MAEPRVAAVVVSYRTRALTLEAVASVLASRGVDLEVWVVDNASGDGTVPALRAAYPGVEVVELTENVGFGRGNNVALERIGSPWILLLNSDATLPDPEALRALVDVLRRHPRAAVVGPRLEDADGRVQLSVRALPSVTAELVRGLSLHPILPRDARSRLLGSEFRDHGRSGEAGWLAGACLVVRREAVEEVGGFDPAIFMYGEEMEWMWRLREEGWTARYEADVTVRHLRRGGGGELRPWQRLASMAGDAYAVRVRRGTAYFAAFAAARTVRFAAQALLQGGLALLTSSRSRAGRSREARRDLGAWLHALALGGARRPGSPPFLPPGHPGREGEG